MEHKSKSTEIDKTRGQESHGSAGLSHDRAITGAAAFSRDGAGPEKNERAGAEQPVRKPVPGKRTTGCAGWGVQSRKRLNRPPAKERVNPAPVDHPAEEPENYGDVIFLLYDRMDRLTARQDRKIERLSHRVSELEERGRFR